MVKDKTMVLTIARGGPRGFYVFWSTDSGGTWLTDQKRALRSEKELQRYHKYLAEKLPDAEFKRVDNPEGSIPKEYWKGEVGKPMTVVDRVMMRRFTSDRLHPKRQAAPSPMASAGPAFEWKSGQLEGVEVRRGFNFRSLSLRIEGDRPTVKTLQEWQRFIKHLPLIQKAVEKFEAFVGDSQEYRAKLEKLVDQMEKANREKLVKEAEKRLRSQQ